MRPGSPRPAADGCRPALFIAALVLGASASWGAADENDLAQQSLALRTVLHRDPMLGAPFERLLALYRQANRIDELIGIYRGHLTRYPADLKATTVLIRVLLATGDPEAGGLTRNAVERHPENACLHYLLYAARRAEHEPGALDELDRAIDLEALPARKRAWIEEFLPAAVCEDRYDLAEKHLRGLTALAGDSAEARLEVARKMMSYRLHDLAFEVLEAAANASPPPDAGVEIQMAAASAEVGLNRMDAAAARLDRLLSKVTADYWRRPEILRRRVALVKSEAQQQAMIRLARERVKARPHDEAGVLDLARLLAGFELRREALKVLLEGGKRVPASERIEKETLELFDRLLDERGREAYLAERMKALPGREDLAFSHIKSLFVLGRRKEALSGVEKLLADTELPTRLARLLELARYLRRSSLPSDAARMFKRAVGLVPSRLDVRRELAETYLVTGDRRHARELFAAGLPRDAAAENLMDALQFMIEQEMFLEARAALRARLAEDRTDFELRLMLLDLEGRLGDQTSGEKLIAGTRELADTDARYALWLETAVAFEDMFDSVDIFLEEERRRIDAEGGGHSTRASLDLELRHAQGAPSVSRGESFGNERQGRPEHGRGGGRAAGNLERRMILADVAARSGLRVEAAESIRRVLDEGLPTEVRCKLRRRLVEILEEDEAQGVAVEQQLKALLRDDPRRADEYRARLALLQFRQGRRDLVRPLLEEIDVTAVRDPVVLGRLENLYRNQGDGRKAMKALERLTVLDPTNRANWQRWLSALAAAGDEPRLREALRKLLAGVERMPIADETRALLRSHFVDSYWRSIGQLLADGLSASLADALALLDPVERTAHTRMQWLWVAWTRAYLLNRLGRWEARDEAVKELERVVADARSAGAREEQDPKEPDAVAEGIAFPDGLTMSMACARRLLTGWKTPADTFMTDFCKGPLPEFKVRWAFDAPVPITRILPLDARRMLICDLGGALRCLDTTTGKLLWEREAALPAARGAPLQPGHGGAVRQGVAPRPVTDNDGRIYASAGRQVWCLSADDGVLVWRADVAGRGGVGGMAFAPVFVREGKVLAFDPVRSVAACLDGVNGKLLWEKEIPSGVAGPVSWMNSGASLSGERLLVYGTCAAILDADTGEIEWLFEPERVRKFPVRIEEAHRSSAPFPPPLYGLGGYPTPRQLAGCGLGRGRYWRQAQALQYVNHLGRRSGSRSPQRASYGGMALAAPAVVWAKSQSRFGAFFGERLLLFGQSKLSILHLDLPLAGKELGVAGTYVGMAGRVACLLQQGRLALVDAETGELRTFDLKELTDGQANARVQAAVDGPLVYLTGPAGILCVNALSNLRAFMVPWPKAVAPEKPLSPPQSVQYTWQGVSAHYGSQYGPCMPMVDRVEEGVFYATVTPTRVVALVEKNARE